MGAKCSDGACRQLHANKLRKLVSRIQHVGVVSDQDTDFGPVEYATVPQNVVQFTRPSDRLDSQN